MLRQNPPNLGPERNGSVTPIDAAAPIARENTVDLQRELNKIEEIILDSTRLPMSPLTLVNEDRLLEQLDLVRLNLPSAIRESIRIVQQRDDLLLQAEQIAEEIITAAEQQAAQMLNELGIVQRAEQDAQQIRQQVRQECEQLQTQALSDIDQLQRQAQADWDAARQQAIAECNQIRQGADAYSDDVLQQLERQFTDMLRVIRNGRQQLNPPASTPDPTPRPPRNRDGVSPSTSATPRPERPRR